ncbi:MULTISPECIES: efflux RND transporter permease subunit [unclassified Methylophaga]|jgi:Cu(I)/Ag(I) efflux system membrane protein CusA/SilA|uniref:efflux RND transporter permease subunit n=2 Tax=Methylophaga TaxID=40222 RepID=UPI000C908990|nr:MULTISPECIES: efflux RND transporter permease subunit [unclassified Methylophaga]MAY16609.1 CusA/CzcA family heavy metal efflux RND transporter [Methylophaga sp.]MBN44889.1 CusA/CzcA family heavy metal efflux RND transporter [Methylophaga sp.]|tara:strand:- start:11229 stop:14399 length:3171 start_codon:yes stop_codon:yes gene_type:complete
MIARLIRWSIDNRFLVLLATLMMLAWSLVSLSRTPLDALPDLSDVQVIIKTSWPGQAPQLVEDQVTYPLTTTMLSVPGAKVVRGLSFFGDSYVYVLFEEGTDLYWARSRVLEYLNQAQSRLPDTASSSIGPDATGVGWIYQYALVDKSGTQDISQLRALQDWFLKFELKTVANVAEVATVGGMVKQYQVVVDPDKLATYRIPLSRVIEAINNGNQESGGAVLEMGEAEYMVRASGYLQSLEDFQSIPLLTTDAGISVTLGDVAHIQIGPEIRRAISELNGVGEAVGGIIVMRSGKNALTTIAAVKDKLKTLQKSLPEGVEIVTVYDRSGLIERAVDNLTEKLIEEFIVVALVCLIFLFHLRSALVAIVSLPLGILMAFIVMHWQGINANIMSLGGIAIAVGAMVDAAVVMVENAHKHLERWYEKHPGSKLEGDSRWKVIGDSAVEVGPALFFSLLIITLSFIPIFTLEAQEGRLFSPLAFTKTYAMAAAAGLAVTLIPVLMGYLIRGKIPAENANPLNRVLIALYRPILAGVLKFPKMTLVVASVLLLTSLWPLQHIGSEFMPPLDEGDLLYMPSALPSLSAGKVAELLQQTNRMIKSVPEVKTVYGKAGRADTATDPAPLVMFETTIQFKPREEWRPGMTKEKLIAELDRTVKVPGLTNIWVPPIRNRLDMLATGIKSPVGVKVLGEDLNVIDGIAGDIEKVLKDVPGVTSVFAERLTGGRYVDVDIKRDAAARYGLNINDVQLIISSAVGGMNIGETVEGLQRFPINVRYPREIRDSLASLRTLPIVTISGQQLILSDVANISISDGPPMVRSENSRLAGFVYVDIRDRDLGSAVADMQQTVAENVDLPTGYSVTWSGQFEYLERATAKLKLVVPFTLLIIFVLFYLTFKNFGEALLLMVTLPFSLVGGIWLLYLLGHNLSVASVVGFIALAGVAAEFGVIMLLYLKQAWQKRLDQHKGTEADLLDAIGEGAVLRVRPKAMTATVILAGLLPIMFGSGTGSEVMQRIAAPMVGGMVTAPLLSMLVIPVIYLMIRRPRAQRQTKNQPIQSQANNE